MFDELMELFDRDRGKRPAGEAQRRRPGLFARVFGRHEPHDPVSDRRDGRGYDDDDDDRRAVARGRRRERDGFEFGDG